MGATWAGKIFSFHLPGRYGILSFEVIPMKKIAALSIFGLWCLSSVLPFSWAVEDTTKDPRISGTPQEVADLQKTLRSERMDNLEQNVADLKETVNALADRVQDLERTVDDDNSRQ